MAKSRLETEEQRPTHTVEDYLMAMHVMERDHGEIVAARLAEMFGVAPATVTMTLKRMERDGWISGKGRKGVHLTETGRAAAHSVTRRHMLAEWLLVKMLKVPILETHHEAHGIEHAISPQIEKRLEEELGHPQTCPHGNPFPGCEHVTRNWLPLTALQPGQQVVIRRIHEFAEDNLALLRYLHENGVLPGAAAQVVEVLPFNQTLTLQVEERQVILGYASAQYIYAEILS
jgi:DtxR family Mn-dependent transcriptional regulator